MRSLSSLCFEKLKVWEMDELPICAKERLTEEHLQSVCGSIVTDALAMYDINRIPTTVGFAPVETPELGPLMNITYCRFYLSLLFKKFLKGVDPVFPAVSYVMYYEEQDPDTKFTPDRICRDNDFLNQILCGT